MGVTASVVLKEAVTAAGGVPKPVKSDDDDEEAEEQARAMS